MATGDLQGNLERMRGQLRSIGFSSSLDIEGLKAGIPASILPLLHYALLGYSRHVARYLATNGYELYAKSDLRFIECLLKFLRNEFGYRCPLTLAQIFSRGFSERKILFVHDVIQVCKRKHNELLKASRQVNAPKHANQLSQMKGESLNGDAFKSVQEEFYKHMGGNIELKHNDFINLERSIFNRNSRQSANVLDAATSQPSTSSCLQKSSYPGINVQHEDSSHTECDVANESKSIKQMLNGNANLSGEPWSTPRDNTLQRMQMESEHPLPPGGLAPCDVTNTDAHQEKIYPSQKLSKVKEVTVSTLDSSRPNGISPGKMKKVPECYEDMKHKIGAITGKLETCFAALEQTVARRTGNLEDKLIALENRVHLLEKALPSQTTDSVQNFLSSYQQCKLPAPTCENSKPYEIINSPIRCVERHQPFQSLHSSAGMRDISNTHHRFQHPLIESHIHFGDPGTFKHTYLQHQQQLSTQELIANVKAHCYRTKQLLKGGEWHS